MIIQILLWIIATLAVCSFSAIVAKKYGVVYIVGITVSLIVMANVLASKIVNFGPFVVPGGVIVFSMTFLLTDIISEHWGQKLAKKTVWTGFYALAVYIISTWIVLAWSSPEFGIASAEQFKTLLGLTPRIAIASMIGYLVGQHHDVWSFHYWKNKTKGKHLWLRNNASTIVSQFIDSTLFITIAFYGILPIWPLILGTWISKTVIALMDTPFMYLIISMLKKIDKKKILKTTNE